MRSECHPEIMSLRLVDILECWNWPCKLFICSIRPVPLYPLWPICLEVWLTPACMYGHVPDVSWGPEVWNGVLTRQQRLGQHWRGLLFSRVFPFTRSAVQEFVSSVHKFLPVNLSLAKGGLIDWLAAASTGSMPLWRRLFSTSTTQP